MPISYNEKDFNIPQIVAASGVSAVPTKLSYRIYGLKPVDNPAISLESRTGQSLEPFAPLVKFFNFNNIFCEAINTDDDKNRVFIGLRSDLRENVQLCAAIVQTIIHQLEGQLKGNLDFKIKCKGYPNSEKPKHKKAIKKKTDDTSWLAEVAYPRKHYQEDEEKW